MALLDFPSGPSAGQTYGLNGNTWQWNGTSWSALGNGFSDGGNFTSCNSIVFDSTGTLYASGDFTRSGSTPLKCAGKWNGSEGSAILQSITSPVCYPTITKLFIDGNG